MTSCSFEARGTNFTELDNTHNEIIKKLFFWEIHVLREIFKLSKGSSVRHIKQCKGGLQLSRKIYSCKSNRGNVFTAEVVVYERARVNEKREPSATFPFTFAQDTP